MATRNPIQAATRVTFERTNFRTLLAANLNYFGSFPATGLKPVKAIDSDTRFEELICVGLDPDIDLLEAVVHIKQAGGYGGGLCAGGSREFVRFYLSYDAGASWQDEGLVEFAAFDVAGPKPLEVGVTRPVALNRAFCFANNTIRVRAILSWEVAPPPGVPGFRPAYGNIVETSVAVAARRLIPLGDVLAQSKAKVAAELTAILDLDYEVPTIEPTTLSVEALHKLYVKTDVPAHRYLFSEVSARAAGPAVSAAASAALPAALSELKLDPTKLIDLILKTDGDTRFEELSCIGLDSASSALVGIVDVKLPNGYSGGPCTAGSREYVAFWVDWGDGAGWTYAGTTSVRVHDISPMPADGLHYGVFEVVNCAPRRRACSEGPVTARVRAILSWQAPPPPSNPDWVPTWGNRRETTVLVPPAALADYRPILESVSGVPICNIDQATGRTSGVYDQPFGGLLTITGFIPTAPDLSTPTASLLRYRVSVREYPGGAWQTVDNAFSISVIERIGNAPLNQYSIPQLIGPDGYYIYREDSNTTGAGWRFVQNHVLAEWITAQPMSGRYEIRVEAKDPITGVVYAAQVLSCQDGSSRSTVIVELDEIAPDCAIAITGYRRGGGPLQTAQDCDTFRVGDELHGTYAVSDAHFGSLSLTVEPGGPAHGASPSPSNRAYPVVATSGESASWTLDTTGMDACGYIVRLWSQDRTILSGDGSGWKCSTSIGFCLRAH